MEQTLCITDSLDVSTVAACRESWLKALTDSPDGLSLRVDGITAIDTPGLQLLLALRKEAERQAKALVFSGANEVLRDQSRLLGLEGALGIHAGSA